MATLYFDEEKNRWETPEELGYKNDLDIIQRRRSGQKEKPDFGGNQPSGMTASQRAGQNAVRTASSGGSAMDIGTGALMASGNPYAMGAGVGLAVLSASQKREQAEEEARYMREQNKISSQKEALSRLMDMSNSLKRL